MYKLACYKLLTQGSPANHVIYATRSANYNMHTHVKFPHVLSHIGATDTCMALGTHEVTQSNNHLLNLLTKKNVKFTVQKWRLISKHKRIILVKYWPATTVVTTDNDNETYRSIRKHNPQEMNLVLLCTKDAQN